MDNDIIKSNFPWIRTSEKSPPIKFPFLASNGYNQWVAIMYEDGHFEPTFPPDNFYNFTVDFSVKWWIHLPPNPKDDD